MVRYRAAYKKKVQRFAEGGAVLSAEPLVMAPAPVDVEIDTPAAHVAADHLTEQMMPVVEAQDDASAALQHQIDALRNSERIQKDRTAQAPALPRELNHDEILDIWREQGLSGVEAEFLREHPRMIDRPDLLAVAAAATSEAAKEHGIEPNTPQYFEILKSTFDSAKDYKPSSSVDKVLKEARSEAAKIESSETSGSHLAMPSEPRISYSAPVSREYVPGNSAVDRYWLGGGETKPGQVRMTPEMKEASRIAGISEREYAEQVLRLRAEKAQGNYNSGS